MKRVVFDDVPLPADLQSSGSSDQMVRLKPGDYVAVKVNACTSGTLLAQPLAKTTLQAFASAQAATKMHAAAQPVEERQAAAAAY